MYCFLYTYSFCYSDLRRALGKRSEIEPMTEAVLMEHGVDYEDFAPEVGGKHILVLKWICPDRGNVGSFYRATASN